MHTHTYTHTHTHTHTRSVNCNYFYPLMFSSRGDGVLFNKAPHCTICFQKDELLESWKQGECQLLYIMKSILGFQVAMQRWKEGFQRKEERDGGRTRQWLLRGVWRKDTKEKGVSRWHYTSCSISELTPLWPWALMLFCVVTDSKTTSEFGCRHSPQ